MSSDKLYKRIESAGVQGIRNMKLRREFGTKTGKIIEELLSQDLIFGEKKGGTTTYYWSKDNYMQHLMDSDPKFKLIYDMYSNTNTKISSKISRISNNIDKKVSTMTSDLSKKVASDLDKKVASIVAEVKAPARTDENGNGDHNGNHLTLDQFRMEIDRVIAQIPTSIGWVELAAIRENVCSKYNISKENFYALASQLFDQFNNRYELSSGGNEGVIVRGLVHGFVRCI